MQSIINEIKLQIKNNKTIIYIKGTPTEPLCGFSGKLVYMLETLNIEYTYINIIENQNIRKALPIYSNWPTFPQLYHKGDLIGGFDIAEELFKNKTLKKILST